MEKTLKELLEEAWEGTCRRPLRLCQWRLSFFGDHIYLRDENKEEYNNEEI